MTRRFLLLPFALIAATLALASETQLSLMTYNIRLDISSDGPNQWDHRKEQVAAQIGFLQPDVLGLQEALSQQVDYLDQELPGYAYVGVGRDDAERAGEFSAVFYRADSTEALSSDTFWLSETPEVPSYGWGASYRRICTYAHFKDKASGQTYWVFNTHFDHEVALARLNATTLILERIKRLVGEDEPYFVIGDLNATPEAPPIQLLKQTMKDARVSCQGPVFGPEGTFNGFKPELIPDRRIDYIFTSPDRVTVAAYATFSDLIELRYPSDHFPVMIRCTLTE